MCQYCVLTSVRVCSVDSLGFSCCRASSVVCRTRSLRCNTKEDCCCRRILNKSLRETKQAGRHEGPVQTWYHHPPLERWTDLGSSVFMSVSDNWLKGEEIPSIPEFLIYNILFYWITQNMMIFNYCDMFVVVFVPTSIVEWLIFCVYVAYSV